MNKKLKTIFLSKWVWVISISICLAACGSSEQSAESQTSDGDITDSIEVQEVRNIVFFGNSLTAGYGLDDPSLAFAGLIQTKLDSLGYPYKVINAGVSGETTAGGNSRIEWILKQPMDIFILELGGNDGLRGIPVSETERNLQEILDKVHAKYPDAKRILAGMQIPPNLGQEYTSEFRELYPEIAKRNNIDLIPFLLDKVGGESNLNLPDGIHPNVAGHKIVAENVWKILQPLLEKE